MTTAKVAFDEGLTIEKIGDNDFAEVLAFMNEDFLFNEPLNDCLAATEEEFEPLFIDIIKGGLDSGLSYLIRANDTNKIVALRITAILTWPDDQSHDEEIPSYPSWKPTAILALLTELERKLWSLIPSDIHKLAYWSVISVSSDYARRSIGRRLINYQLDELKEAGCQGIATEATAFKSQQLFIKDGYNVLYEIKHADWKDKAGKQIFKCNDATDRAILIYKPL